MSLLAAEALEAGYGPIQVLRHVDIAVEDGEIVALIGANGAGKTTTLRALSGTSPARGRIRFDGQDVAALSAAARARRGIARIPQGRGTFVEFTVEENLALGAYGVRSRQQIRRDAEHWYDVFPRLRERRSQLSGSLSGGEQQMLAVARALMSRPRILMCDEPSLGLAPVVTRGLFDVLAALNREQGMAILLVEQNADLALRVAHRAYVLEAGAIGLAGTGRELRDHPAVQRAYLGA
jgi:branched-chain amino acid transport system ATP-binding protein